jgi:hypothetical protein
MPPVRCLSVSLELNLGPGWQPYHPHMHRSGERMARQALRVWSGAWTISSGCGHLMFPTGDGLRWRSDVGRSARAGMGGRRSGNDRRAEGQEGQFSGGHSADLSSKRAGRACPLDRGRKRKLCHAMPSGNSYPNSTTRRPGLCWPLLRRQYEAPPCKCPRWKDFPCRAGEHSPIFLDDPFGTPRNRRRGSMMTPNERYVSPVCGESAEVLDGRYPSRRRLLTDSQVKVGDAGVRLPCPHLRRQGHAISQLPASSP